MYRAFIFDFFNVVHSDPLEIWLQKYGYVKEGEFAEISRQLDLGNISYQTYVKRLALLNRQLASELVEEFKAFSYINEDVVELIGTLRNNGYKMGLLTNTTSEEIKPILKRHGLEESFDEIIISSEVGLAKPDIPIFRLMLKRLDVVASQAVFIDDNSSNVQAAKKLGVTGIVFNSFDSLEVSLKSLGINAKVVA